MSSAHDEKKETDTDATVAAITNTNDDDTSTDKNPVGSGWSSSNPGAANPQMFPLTRNGRLSLYSGNRRWIGLNKGWSRVGAKDGEGKETDQFSHRTTGSAMMKSIVEDADREAIAVRSLIAQLCEQYYKFGWATGTAGGVSIRVGGPSENRPWRVFVAPSGIQKEDMIGDDVFELDMEENVVHGPKTDGLKLSACTPIWYLVYKHRPSARSVVHTHSMNAQLATLLDPSEEAKVLRVTHLEMIKGVGGHAYDDVLEIPIIDNRPSEDMLAPQMEEVFKNYPKCTGILVRRHGIFVWGDSWEQAKTRCESFEYLFESAIGMRKLGVDFSAIPAKGTFRDDESSPSATNKRGAAPAPEEEPPSKRSKPAEPSTAAAAVATTGWNASGNIDNEADLGANPTPLLPRDHKYLLLDIEGCTTAISFVKDVLFPYVIEHAEGYIAKNLSTEEKGALAKALGADLTPDQSKEANTDDPASLVRYMVKNDLKVASLKSLQGKMWKDGYKNGTLKGHVYDDFVPMLEWMKSQGVHVYIYSSGSVQAQKLLFGNSVRGDLTSYFEGHFDITTSGNKKVSGSYTKIAESIGVPPGAIVFCSDAVTELEAATEAGIRQCVMTVRPGNAPLSKEASEAHPRIFSLLQLCGNGK